MDLNLKSIFEKPIDRPIDGVIKADDEESILNELEEYVITNEIEKNINDFLNEYNNYTNKNGVWISGFFGFFKILWGRGGLGGVSKASWRWYASF